MKQLILTSSYARLRYWTAIALYLLILILGSLPGARQDIGQVATGVVLHSIAYAGLAFLVYTGVDGGAGRRAVLAVAHIAVMGALDEYVQSFFPYRHAAVSDWAVDCTAAVLTSLVLWLLWRRRPLA